MTLSRRERDPARENTRVLAIEQSSPAPAQMAESNSRDMLDECLRPPAGKGR